MNLKTIAIRAVVTVFEAFLAVVLAGATTDLSPEALETAVVAGAAAGLSVIYNSLRGYLADIEAESTR